MTKLLTITRWIYNEKNVESRNGIAICEETRYTVQIEVINVTKETEKAINITTYDYEMSVVSIWIPKSQIKDSNFEIKVEEKVKAEPKSVVTFETAKDARTFCDQLKADGKKAFIMPRENRYEVIEK